MTTLFDLFKIVLDATRLGKLEWKPVMTEGGDPSFITEMAGGIIRIVWKDDGSYCFLIENADGVIIDSDQNWRGEYFEASEEMFKLARLKASGGQELMENMLENLTNIVRTQTKRPQLSEEYDPFAIE